MHALLAVLLVTLAPAQVFGSALDVWKCQDRVVVYDGPAGTGKTFADCLLAFVRADKYPGCRQLFVRDTRRSLSQTVQVTFEDKVVGAAHPSVVGASRSHRESYRFPNGSEIVLGGLDNPGRIMSAEYDFIYVFEATVGVTEEAVEYLITRLRNGAAVQPDGSAKHQIILECNPDHPSHWIKQWFEKGRASRVRSTHRDNPSLYDQRTGELTRAGVDYLENTLSKMTGHRKKRLLLGEWAGAEGLVYDTFNRDANVRTITRDWPETIIACDDGISNPFVALLCRIDEDDRIHVEREHYASNMLIAHKVDAIRTLQAGGKCEGCEVIVDPAAAQLIAEMRDGGIEVMSADNKRDDGINRLHTRLAPDASGTPRVTVDPSCANTIREFESYMRKKHKDGHFLDEPEKVNDHAMDALRYAVNRVDGRMSLQLIEATGTAKADDWEGWG